MPIQTFTANITGDGHAIGIIIVAPLYKTFTLIRRPEGSASTQEVRGAIDAPLRGRGGMAFVRDVELPQGVVFEYQVTVETDIEDEPPVLVSDWVAVDGALDHGGNVLFDLASVMPPLVVKVNAWTTLNHDISVDTAWVENRPDPIVISGSRRSPSSAMSLLLIGNDDYRTLLAMLNGGITCFAPRNAEHFGTDGLIYFSVGKIDERRITSPDPREAIARIVTLSLQQITSPPADFVPSIGVTWQERVDQGITWQRAKDEFSWERLGYG